MRALMLTLATLVALGAQTLEGYQSPLERYGVDLSSRAAVTQTDASLQQPTPNVAQATQKKQNKKQQRKGKSQG